MRGKTDQAGVERQAPDALRRTLEILPMDQSAHRNLNWGQSRKLYTGWGCGSSGGKEEVRIGKTFGEGPDAPTKLNNKQTKIIVLYPTQKKRGQALNTFSCPLTSRTDLDYEKSPSWKYPGSHPKPTLSLLWPESLVLRSP